MILDLNNPAHVEALALACRTYQAAQTYGAEWLARVLRETPEGPTSSALRALSSPEQSAAIVRAILERCEVAVYPSDEDPGDSIRFPCVHVDPDGDVIVWQGWTRYVPHADIGGSFDMKVIPALILSLLDATDRDGALTALRAHT